MHVKAPHRKKLKPFPSPRHRIHFALGAVQALELYLDRGKTALRHLLQSQVDAAVIKLNDRDIAYNQFLQLDHLAKDAGQDITKDQNVRDLWAQIRAVNDELLNVLKTHGEVDMKELQRTAETWNLEGSPSKSSNKSGHLRIVKNL